METAIFDRIAQIIKQVQPMIQSDGGDIELIKYEDDIVYVRMHGACVGCPASSFTLSLGIEERLREQIPTIKKVVALD